MDTTLCLYKGKLKEALDLVSRMNHDKKVKAIVYWNDLAGELEQMIQKTATSYSQGILSSHALARASATQTTGYQDGNCANITPIHRDPIVPSNYPIAQSANMTINDEEYAVVKQSGLNSTVPVPSKSIHSATESITSELFCPDADMSYTNNLTSEMSPPTDYKVRQVDSTAKNPGFDGVMMASSLGCPRTTSNVNEEIGNGQFDRGPQDFEDVNNFTQRYGSDPLSQVPLNSFVGAETFASNRNELFTQSDRPLQPIQQFNTTGGDYLTTYSNLIGTTRHVTFSFCNEQLGGCGDVELHDELRAEGSELDSSIADKVITDEIDPQEMADDISANSGTDTIAAGSNQHICGVCGKSGFSTKGNLKRHLRAHSGEKPFKCEHCDSCFTEKKSLKIHLRRHTGEKPYKCETCGKLFSQTGVLQSHMALHLNERKFDCHKCGKAFRQRSQLKLHLMRHDGVKRLECSTCRARFLTKGDLERHCRIHTGERPYACQTCGKTFTRQQSLNEHMNRHTGRRPYDCKYCDKKFSEMSACYKHAKTHKKQDQNQQRELCSSKQV